MAELICKNRHEYNEWNLDRKVIDQLIEEINKSQLQSKLQGVFWKHTHRVQDFENAGAVMAAAEYLTYVSDIRYSSIISENNIRYISFFFKGDEEEKDAETSNEEYKSPFNIELPDSNL